MGASIKQLPSGDTEFRESFSVGAIIYTGVVFGGALILLGLFTTPFAGWVRVVLIVLGLTVGLLAGFNARRSRAVVTDTSIRIQFMFFRTREVAIADVESIDPRRGGFSAAPDIWTKAAQRLRL